MARENTGGRGIAEELSHREAVASPKRTDLEGIGGNIKEANLKEDSSITKRTLKKHPSIPPSKNAVATISSFF